MTPQMGFWKMVCRDIHLYCFRKLSANKTLTVMHIKVNSANIIIFLIMSLIISKKRAIKFYTSATQHNYYYTIMNLITPGLIIHINLLHIHITHRNTLVFFHRHVPPFVNPFKSIIMMCVICTLMGWCLLGLFTYIFFVHQRHFEISEIHV